MLVLSVSSSFSSHFWERRPDSLRSTCLERLKKPAMSGFVGLLHKDMEFLIVSCYFPRGLYRLGAKVQYKLLSSYGLGSWEVSYHYLVAFGVWFFSAASVFVWGV